jgi:hypothetical protein
MANVASNPNLWTGAHSDSPPSWWNGTAYVMDDAARNGIGTVMTLKAMPGAGNTFTVNFQNFVSPNPPGTSSVLEVLVNGSAVHSFNLIGASGPTEYSYAFTGSETSFGLQAITNNGGQFTTYGADFSLTPTNPPAPVASNESQSVAFNSQNNPITYQIEFSGSPVTPSSVAIVSQPTNGTATVSGLTILYTPTYGYDGADSFTYNAVYEGQTSNTATISIFVEPFPTPAEVRLRWTDDGGHNWSNFMGAPMGAIGQTSNRVIFRRLGSTRDSTGLDRVFEISSDAYTQTCLVGASFLDA